MAATGLDVDQFGERVGWDVTKILADPQELWEINTDGFRDVAKAAGVEWTAAFPRSSGPTNLRGAVYPELQRTGCARR